MLLFTEQCRGHVFHKATKHDPGINQKDVYVYTSFCMYTYDIINIPVVFVVAVVAFRSSHITSAK